MEQILKISTDRKYNVIGRLRGDFTKQPLVIFLHGLGSNMDHHLFYNGARFFEHKKFASFRFNFYGVGKGFRVMKQGSLAQQAKDLREVVAYFKKQKVKKIFVVGHSYGGLTILLSTLLSIDGISLWDASFNPYDSDFSNMEYMPEVRGYVYKKAFDVILGKKLVEEAKKLDCVVLAKNITKPLQVVCAGNGSLLFGGNLYFKNARGKKEFVSISGAGHNFHEDGAEERLFKRTHQWFKKVL